MAEIITITAVATVEGDQLDIAELYRLLPINQHVLSLAYQESKRGVIYSDKPSAFDNAIQARIQPPGCEKVLTLKLTKTSIQFTGLKRPEQGEQGLAYLVDLLDQLQAVAGWYDDYDPRQLCGQLIPSYIVDDPYTMTLAPTCQIPEVPSYARDYLASMSAELELHQAVVERLNELQNSSQRSRNSSFGRVKTCMIRYRWKLGYMVNVYALARALQQYDDILVNFDPNLNKGVKLLLPCQVPEEYQEDSRRRGYQRIYQTFTIQPSGDCAQSGFNLDFDSMAFDYIEEILSENEETIRFKSDRDLVEYVCAGYL